MDKFLRQAIKLGLCDKWQREWEETGLIEKYINGITWCMFNEFPSLKDMKKYDKALLRNGVYNEKSETINCNRDMYVFNNSNIDFEIEGYDVCRLYVGRNSNLNIRLSDHAIVFIDNYGGNINSIIKDNTAKCVVWDRATRNMK